MFKYGLKQGGILPAPQIKIKVNSLENESLTSEVVAVIDTGSQITCVPQWIIDYLQPLIYDNARFRGVFGQEISRTTYFVGLQIAHCVFSDHEVLAYDRDYALIGRDILNGYAITFDGQRQVWRVEEKCI